MRVEYSSGHIKMFEKWREAVVALRTKKSSLIAYVYDGIISKAAKTKNKFYGFEVRQPISQTDLHSQRHTVIMHFR